LTVKNEIWHNYFDIVILPPAPVRDHALALSRELKKAGGVFVLGRRSYLPHLSLYHIPVRPADYRRFSEKVRQVAARTEPGALRLRSIESALLMTTRPLWLRRLHLDVVSSTLPYFDWKYGAAERWTVDRIPARLRASARRNLKKFGSPMIDSVFRPHITLTTFKESHPENNLRVHPEPMTFDVTEIAICELGPHHSCQRVLELMELGGT
jgi:hypothetical protein